MKRSVKTLEKCYNDFKEALAELIDSLEEAQNKNSPEDCQQKVIRAFELTHELSLNTISEYLRKQGRPAYQGPRDTTVDAFHEDLIDDGEGWLDMIIIRIKTSPIYSEDTTKVLYEKIISHYLHLFENFNRKMDERLEGN